MLSTMMVYLLITDGHNFEENGPDDDLAAWRCGQAAMVCEELGRVEGKEQVAQVNVIGVLGVRLPDALKALDALLLKI